MQIRLGMWSAVLALCAVLAPGCLYADTLLQFGQGVGAGYPAGVNGVNAGGYYVSPYYARDLTTEQNLVLYCVDFNHEINFNDTWQANITPLSEKQYQYKTVKDTDVGTYFGYALGGLSVFDRYLAAAWLFSRVQGPDVTNTLLITTQYAAWGLLVEAGNYTNYITHLNATGLQNSVVSKLNDATTAIRSSSVDDLNQLASQWQVVTDAAVPLGKQEFLTRVPEPSGILLLLAAAGVLLGVERRRLRT